MKLSNYKYVLFTISGFLFITAASCKKTLEETPYSFLSPGNFYTSSANAIAAINGVYNELNTYDLYMQPFWNLTMTDDDHVSGADWYLGNAGAGNPQSYWGVDRPWAGLYTLIARANAVIENVEGMSAGIIDTTTKSRILGEAHFFRGWSYFHLVQLYGGVPIRLQSVSADTSSSGFNKPRATVAETYATVIDEFKQAENLLYSSTDSRSGEAGRVTKGLAKAYLAKTYLTMASGALQGSVAVIGGTDNASYTYAKDVVAGYGSFDSKTYYQLAKDKALEVAGSGDYSLFTNWSDVFTIGNRNGKEFLWEIQSVFGSSFVNNLHAYLSARSPFGTGAMWMTNDHYKNYDITDTRVLDGVTHQYQANWGGYYYYPSWQASKYNSSGTYNNDGKNDGDNKAFVNKFSYATSFNNDQLGTQYANNNITGTSDAFFPVMRFSEVLLMVAEAENEVNGATSTAYQYLGLVRSRCNATTAPAGMSRQDMRSYILEERGREFALENIRRYDLIRWGIYLQVMNKIGTGQNSISKVRLTRNLLLPIPQSELNSNKAITGNNPGW